MSIFYIFDAKIAKHKENTKNTLALLDHKVTGYHKYNVGNGTKDALDNNDLINDGITLMPSMTYKEERLSEGGGEVLPGDELAKPFDWDFSHDWNSDWNHEWEEKHYSVTLTLQSSVVLE